MKMQKTQAEFRLLVTRHPDKTHTVDQCVLGYWQNRTLGHINVAALPEQEFVGLAEAQTMSEEPEWDYQEGTKVTGDALGGVPDVK